MISVDKIKYADPGLRRDDETRVVAVHSLTLTHFRNYASARLEVDARPVILTGPNGAGKTNLLEAVSFLAPGRGLRRAKLGEIDQTSPLLPLQGGGWVGVNSAQAPHLNPPPDRGRKNNMPWTVAATLSTPQGETQIGTGRDASMETETDKRLVKINGKSARSNTELAQHVSMVWLTPENDRLFQEGNSARRRFLDRLVYGFDPDHASRVNAYEYAMRERNRLLSERRADPAWLSTLEQKMAETATAIAAARLQTVAHLNQVMQDSPLRFPKAEMALSGLAEDALKRGEAASNVEQTVAAALARSRPVDAASGRTSLGAHRAELAVIHLQKNMEAALCSTGEQKALLLSIVLAEARAGAIWHGRVPILLLDEAVAHLDEQKRIELFEEILSLGAQAWMTGTDTSLFNGMLGKAQVFRVEMGNVFPY